jgi:hypothetical protein
MERRKATHTVFAFRQGCAQFVPRLRQGVVHVFAHNGLTTHDYDKYERTILVPNGNMRDTERPVGLCPPKYALCVERASRRCDLSTRIVAIDVPVFRNPLGRQRHCRERASRKTSFLWRMWNGAAGPQPRDSTAPAGSIRSDARGRLLLEVIQCKRVIELATFWRELKFPSCSDRGANPFIVHSGHIGNRSFLRHR